MKRFSKSIKTILISAFSFMLYFATSVFVSASDASDPAIKFDVDPKPVIATVVLVFGLFIALILALMFLFRHMRETKNRVSRLSKIKSEDTIQLYDDLDDEKWHNEGDSDEKPRDVRIEDNYSKSASVKARGNNIIKGDSPENETHGPVPERDMPGYDPYAESKDNELKPVVPYASAPDTAHYSPVVKTDAPKVAEQPAAVPGPVPGSPIVYRPDSDVEIIMRDSSEPTANADNSVNVVCNLYPESAAAAPSQSVQSAAATASAFNAVPEVQATAAALADEPQHKVRAVRRRGKVPGLVTRASLDPATAAQRTMAASGIGGRALPRFNINSLSITPKINTAVYENTEQTLPSVDKDYNIKLRGLPVVEDETVVTEPELTREAPIVDLSTPEVADDTNDITVKLVPPIGSSDEAVVRTLDDVLDELGTVGDEDDITELEAIDKPVREEELVFLGSGTVSDDFELDDDIFVEEDGEARMFLNGKYTLVRYKTSFLSRFIQSEEKIQDYYSVLKNVLMSYKGIESALGWSCETFTHNGETCAKINVVDKMLLLYLALDPERYHNYKYHYTYAYTKYKSTKVPMFIKVKSDRALKYALELIVALMNDLSLESGEMPDIDYRRPYETIPALVDRGLIKIVAKGGDDADFSVNKSEIDAREIAEKLGELTDSEETDVAGGAVFDFADSEQAVKSEPMIITVDDVQVTTVDHVADKEKAAYASETKSVEENPEKLNQPVVHANAQNADLLLSDEEAIAAIEIVEDAEHVSSNGKIVEVNLDSICAVFNDGDVVNLKTLKAKRLISQNAERVKVLARGTMTKTLTIYADRFSLQAVKMITLAGGHAEQYK